MHHKLLGIKPPANELTVLFLKVLKRSAPGLNLLFCFYLQVQKCRWPSHFEFSATIVFTRRCFSAAHRRYFTLCFKVNITNVILKLSWCDHLSSQLSLKPLKHTWFNFPLSFCVSLYVSFLPLSCPLIVPHVYVPSFYFHPTTLAASSLNYFFPKLTPL